MQEDRIDMRSVRISDFAHCPICGSANIRKYGHTKSGTQRFKCDFCGRTFTGRKQTILYHSRLRPGQLRLVLSMLIDGETIRQICHLTKLSIQTVLFYRRKVQKLFEDVQKVQLCDEVWVDETYVNVSQKDQVYSHRRNQGKRGLCKDQLQIQCGVDIHGNCFARVGGRGTPSNKDAETGYGGKVRQGSIVHHDEGHYGAAFIGSIELAHNSRKADSHSKMNQINSFTNLVQRLFRIHLRIHRKNINSYLNMLCFMYRHNLESFNKLQRYLIRETFSSGKTLIRTDLYGH